MSEEATAEETQEVEAPTEDVTEDSTDAAVDAVAKLMKDKSAEGDDESTDEVELSEDKEDSVQDDAEEDVSDSEDEDESDEEEAEDDTVPQFSDELLDRAHSAGFTISEAKAFGTPEALEQGLKLIERKQNPDGDTADADETQELPKLDPEEYDEDVIKMVESRDEVIAEQRERLKDLEAKFEEQSTLIRQQQEQQFYEQVDDVFEGMKSWGDVIGKGRYGDLEPESPDVQNRVKVLEEFAVLQEADAKAGRSTSMKKQLEKAAKNVFPKIATKIETAKIAAAAKKRQNSLVNKPRADREHRHDPTDRAEAAVARMMEEKGAL